MYNTNALDFLPLWAVFFGSATSIIIAVEIGYAFGKRRIRGLAEGEMAHLGGGVTATLGLLAFMLAFSFGAGTDRWDAKKALLIAETNAIGTAFLRSELLEAARQSAVKNLLSGYVDQRVKMAQPMNADEKRVKVTEYANSFVSAVEKAKDFHSALWRQAKEAAIEAPTPITALFVSAINDVIDIHQERVSNAIQHRMPFAFWIVLFCLAMLSMFLLGYDAGVSRSARSRSAWVVAFSFATIMFLVVMLDRPQTSLISQFPMLELQADIHQSLRGS